MNTTKLFRNLAFILLGILILILKRYYSGPFEEQVYAYGSNISVSFVIYFIILIGLENLPQTRLLALSGSLIIVELFELTSGFGFLSNTYDPMDYVANALGITLALVADLLLDRPGLQKEEDDE